MNNRFNKELCDEIVHLYSTGLPIKTIADLLGINRQTIYRWRKKGEKEGEGEYYDFDMSMKKAHAKNILFHLKKLNRSNKDNTHKFLLEVSDPETYNLSNKIEHSGELNIKENVKLDSDLIDRIISEKKANYPELN